MTKVSQQAFQSLIRNGDFGVIQSSNFFAKLQKLFWKKFNEGDLFASHAFYVKNPPEISEANGLTVSGSATYLKYTGDTTKAWFFRNMLLSAEQLDDMNTYTLGAEETGGHYSVWGILQFAKKYVTPKYQMKDESGVFCSEYIARIVEAAHIPFTQIPPWQLDPSSLLNWAMSEDAKIKGWVNIATYDGTKDGYYVS
jgi:hypothetical protein